MSKNNPEFEPGHDDETVDEPFDGRESQPVAEGSSDDPRTLEALDPLRDAELLIEEIEPPLVDPQLEEPSLEEPQLHVPLEELKDEEEERFDAG